jgi:hypothetical protein
MYYPLSQIISNLYTNGEEFTFISNGLPYIGYYWKTSNEKYYSGKTPQDLPNEELILISNTINVSITPPTQENNFSYYNEDGISSEYITLTSPPSPKSTTNLFSKCSY